jgi:hypothetical protein
MQSGAASRNCRENDASNSQSVRKLSFWRLDIVGKLPAPE